MYAPYELVSFALKTGLVLDVLPVTGISYTETLNASGSMTCGVPLAAPMAAPERLFPGGTGLAVLRGGAPVWGGILWSLTADLSAGTLTLNSSGFHSHYRGKTFVAGESKNEVDQGAILRDWLARSNTNNGIGTDYTKIPNTGRKRSRAWTKFEAMSVAAAIEDLADDGGGFNFRYVPYWIEPGVKMGNRFLISAVSGAKSKNTLEHRVNCDVASVSYDSTSLATNVYMYGADDTQGAKPTFSVSNPELFAKIPAKDVIKTFSDVKSVTTLSRKAEAAISVGRAPIAIPAVVVYPGLFSPEQFVPGDVETVHADHGYVALFSEFVLTERKVDVDANGRESIALSLANRELFENGNAG
ncbi:MULTISPECIES: hypothetical protein [Streptomyces]|uniref:hypothetical protein n=1 Tax=Streptomyces TaxID=1883 RepID=UPI00345C564F